MRCARRLSYWVAEDENLRPRVVSDIVYDEVSFRVSVMGESGFRSLRGLECRFLMLNLCGSFFAQGGEKAYGSSISESCDTVRCCLRGSMVLCLGF